MSQVENKNTLYNSFGTDKKKYDNTYNQTILNALNNFYTETKHPNNRQIPLEKGVSLLKALFARDIMNANNKDPVLVK